MTAKISDPNTPVEKDAAEALPTARRGRLLSGDNARRRWRLLRESGVFLALVLLILVGAVLRPRTSRRCRTRSTCPGRSRSTAFSASG